tara:strand:- start:217 stop:459 length:243 start_codon:yes stop_codon:yes gene_type:complete
MSEITNVASWFRALGDEAEKRGTVTGERNYRESELFHLLASVIAEFTDMEQVKVALISRVGWVDLIQSLETETGIDYPEI